MDVHGSLGGRKGLTLCLWIKVQLVHFSPAGVCVRLWVFAAETTGTNERLCDDDGIHASKRPCNHWRDNEASETAALSGGSWCRTSDGIYGVIYHTQPPAPQKEGQLNATSAPVRHHRQMSTKSTTTPVGHHFSKENICNPNFAHTLTHMEPNDAWAAVKRQWERRRRTSGGCWSCTHRQ